MKTIVLAVTGLLLSSNLLAKTTFPGFRYNINCETQKVKLNLVIEHDVYQLTPLWDSQPALLTKADLKMESGTPMARFFHSTHLKGGQISIFNLQHPKKCRQGMCSLLEFEVSTNYEDIDAPQRIVQLNLPLKTSPQDGPTLLTIEGPDEMPLAELRCKIQTQPVSDFYFGPDLEITQKGYDFLQFDRALKSLKPGLVTRSDEKTLLLHTPSKVLELRAPLYPMSYFIPQSRIVHPRCPIVGGGAEGPSNRYIMCQDVGVGCDRLIQADYPPEYDCTGVKPYKVEDLISMAPVDFKVKDADLRIFQIGIPKNSDEIARLMRPESFLIFNIKEGWVKYEVITFDCLRDDYGAR